jgi:PAS domain S-box-containing protein
MAMNDQARSVPSRTSRYWWILIAVALLAIPIAGVWELFRTVPPSSPSASRLLAAFVVIELLVICGLLTEYFTLRRLLTETNSTRDRLRVAMKCGRSVGWEWDLATGRDYWFGDLQTIFGIEAETWHGRLEDFFQRVHPDDRERISHAVSHARIQGEPYHAEYRVIREDGKLRWLRASGSFYYNRKGLPERMFGMSADITEHKNAEEELRKSEEKFSKAFHASPMALTLTSAIDHRYLDVNKTFEEITGWKREEVIGRTSMDLNIWVDPDERLNFVERLQREGAVRQLEVRFRCRNGSERIGLGSAELIEIANEPCAVSVIADLTEYKEIQKQLHESEQRLRSVVESAMDAIIVVDEKQRIVLFNPAAEKMFGCKANDALGTSLDRFILGALRSQYEQPTRTVSESATAGPSVGTLEAVYGVRADGKAFPVEASISQVDVGGQKLFTAIIRDITERRRADESLRRNEESLRLAMQAGKMYVDEWDASTDTITRYPDYGDILGPDQPRRVTRQQLLEQIHADDRGRVEEFFAGITRENPTSQVSYRLLYPDGQAIWLEKRVRGVFDDHGKFLRAIGVVCDITERKQAEERFRRVVEHIGDAIIVDDVSGHIVFANQRFVQLFGLDRVQLYDLQIENYVAPQFQAELRDRHVRRMRGEPVSTQFEYEGIRRDGHRMWLEVDVVPIVDQTGKLMGTQSAIRDVSERKAAAMALRESEERFRLVANTAPVMIWMAGLDKLCNYFNQQWLDYTGRMLQEELGDGWVDCVHPEDVNACLETYSQAFDKREPFDMQYRLRRYDQQYRWIYDRGVPRFNSDGSFAGYIGSCYDVNDRKLAEEALGSLGRRLIEAHEEERTWIARELHDDINQRLALLTIELDKCRQHLPESAAEIGVQLEKMGKRLFDLSKDVQSLSHRLHSSKLEYLGLVTATRSFCKELSDQHNVHVEFSQSEVPASIPREISLVLFRVLQEALQNAVKYSRAQDFRVDLRGEAREIYLTVRDRGVGFDQDEAMQSRGLGLISMRERLQLVNGSFAIDSKPGEGTTISARVPLKGDVIRLSAAG